MRRALVLVDDAARHPFRKGLPPPVRISAGPEAALSLPGRCGRAAMQALRFGWGRRPFGSGDVRDFLLAYCACFLAVSAFIA